MSKLLILGAGGHGKVVAEVAMLMGAWENIAFLDDNDDIKNVCGVQVIGKQMMSESIRMSTIMLLLL